MLVDCRKCGKPLSCDPNATEVRCPYCGSGTRLGHVEPLSKKKKKKKKKKHTHRRQDRFRDPASGGRKRLRRWILFLGGLSVLSYLSILGARDEVGDRPSAWGNEHGQETPCLIGQAGSGVAAIAGRFRVGNTPYFGVLDGRTGEFIWKHRDPGGTFLCFAPHFFGLMQEQDLILYGSAHIQPIGGAMLPEPSTSIVATGGTAECGAVATPRNEHLGFSLPQGNPVPCADAPMRPIVQPPGVRSCIEGAHLTPVTTAGTFSVRHSSDDEQGGLRVVGAPMESEQWERELALRCAIGTVPMMAMTATPDGLFIVGANEESINQLLGLDLSNGYDLFRKPAPELESIRSLQFDGGEVLLEGRNQLSAFSTRNGSKAWSIGTSMMP